MGKTMLRGVKRGADDGKLALVTGAAAEAEIALRRSQQYSVHVAGSWGAHWLSAQKK